MEVCPNTLKVKDTFTVSVSCPLEVNYYVFITIGNMCADTHLTVLILLNVPGRFISRKGTRRHPELKE